MKVSRFVGMHPVIAILGSALLFTALGCDSPPEFLTKSDQESLAKLRSGQYTLISNQELTTLKHEADTGQNTGRYHIFRSGVRTWRLDTDTGRVCVLLASAADWNKPEIKAQSCASSDPAVQNGDKGRTHAQ